MEHGTMTAGWRSEARQRLNAATPGPWRTDGMHPEVDGPNGEHIISVMRQRREVWERGQDRDRYGHGTFPDIELIAHAPTDLGRALDALDAVLAAIDGMDDPTHCSGCAVANLVRRAIEGTD